MSRLPILSALIFALSPAGAFAQVTPSQPAPAPAPSGPPPAAVAAIQQAATAFGQCVQTGAQAVPATVTPEAGATSVLAGCATQRQQLEAAARSLIAGLPEDQRPGAQEQLRTQMAAIEPRLVEGIRQARAGATTPPAQPPAPAQ